MRPFRVERFAASIAAKPAPRLAVPAGLLAGIAIGVLARVWMRWISKKPEFSWTGSIFIVVAFALFGTVQAAAWSARSARWSRRRLTVVRSLSFVLSLGLFGAAGAIMFPTVAAASLALWRTEWRRWIRGLLAIAAMPVVVIVVRDIGSDKGWNLETAGRVSLYLMIYAAIIVATWPTVTRIDDEWRAGRLLRSLAIIAPVAVLGRLLIAVAMKG